MDDRESGEQAEERHPPEACERAAKDHGGEAQRPVSVQRFSLIELKV